MSTIVFASITSKRIQAPKNRSTTTEPPGVRTYVDTLAALFPGEVLSVHAVIISLAGGQGGAPAWTFWALIFLCVLLYVFARIATKAPFEVWDIPRALIPPLAFVAWTMIQKPTLFDANWPHMVDITRQVIAILGAAVLASAAALLGAMTDKTDPKP
jgi:hypothetical protein